MDQHGQNLNRYYLEPDQTLQPAIFAAKRMLDHYSEMGKLCLYLDFHAHASKRGCFIYGNVMNNLEDQIQNQMFTRLIALNTPHFDYDGYETTNITLIHYVLPNVISCFCGSMCL
jgi:hypothetical protein